MGREKEFDPGDYLGLSEHSPIERWISEFLYRNREFMEAYMKLPFIPGHEREGYIFQLLKKFQILVDWNYPVHPLVDKIPREEALRVRPNIHRPPPVRSFRVSSIDPNTIQDEGARKDYIEWLKTPSLPNSSDRYDQNSCFASSFSPYRGREDVMDWLLAGRRKEDLDKVVFIAIDLKRQMGEIKDHIKKLLSLEKKTGSQSRKQGALWKSYLMVFDLKEQGLSFDQISDKLYEHFPDDERFMEEKTIERYYKNCLALIEGGYKAFV